MVEIASNYNKQLQEKPQMNMARRRAITKMKKHVKETLQDVEIAELRAGTSTEDVEEAIKQNKAGKFSGHSSITYEFWSLERTKEKQ